MPLQQVTRKARDVAALSVRLASAPRISTPIVVIACMLIITVGLYKQIRPQDYQLQDSDFYTYYNAALALRHGANPFAPVASWIQSYVPGSPLRASYYVYAPIFALLLMPFTLISVQAALTLWGICNVAFLFTAIYAFIRAAGMRPSLVAVMVLAAAASIMTTIRIEFYWGQADVFLLCLVCVSFWARQAGRPTLAGLLLALACVTKPPLLILVLLLIWKREIYVAATALVGFFALLFVPFLWLGAGALGDQFAIWSFWSSQYVPFIDNHSPKGVLARLFTFNSYTQPIVAMPIVVNVLWLLVVVLVGVLTVAYLAPRRMRADAHSLLEVGLLVAAQLIISPLTEYIYTTLLVVSLLSFYVLLRENRRWRDPQYRFVLVGAALAWIVMCLPLQHVGYVFSARLQSASALHVLYVLLAAPYLFVMLGFFAFQLYILRTTTRVPVAQAVSTVVRTAPLLLRQWFEDCRADVRRTRRSQQQQKLRGAYSTAGQRRARAFDQAGGVPARRGSRR